MLWHFRFQFSPARGTLLCSSEADAEMGFGVLGIFRDWCPRIVGWEVGTCYLAGETSQHCLQWKEECQLSSEHSGVQDFEGLCPHDPIPDEGVPTRS